MALKYPLRSASLACSPNRLPSRRSLPFRIPSPQQPVVHLPHHHHHHHQAMDAFPDGAFVRLESRVLTGKFVHADEDWRKVTLRPDNGGVPALNAVWRVQHRDGDAEVVGHTYVLLQNAAYGRYLSYSTKKAQRGHRGRRTIQRNHSEPSAEFHPLNPYPWMWTVERLPAPDQDYVSLHYLTCYLRANGRYLRWKDRVTADLDPAAALFTDMMHWRVHRVEESLVPPPHPRPLPLELEGQGDDRHPYPPRTIRHVQANVEGEFDQNHYNSPSFPFDGSSVTSLKNQVRLHQNWNEDIPAYTLCMRPGSHGRLIPLITDDLPRSLDSMNIVVFRIETPSDYSAIFSTVCAALVISACALTVSACEMFNVCTRSSSLVR